MSRKIETASSIQNKKPHKYKKFIGNQLEVHVVPRTRTKTKTRRKEHVLQAIDPEEQTYCICKKIASGRMVACEAAECSIEWFHFRCNGLKAEPQGQGFADKRKKKIQYEYLKMLKKERLTDGRRQPDTYHAPSVDRTDERRRKLHDPSTSSDKRPRLDSPSRDKKHKRTIDTEGQEHVVHRFTKLTEDVKQRKQLKKLKKEEALDRKKERDAAIDDYSKRKRNKFKKLCKKTNKGQPKMKDQIEYLLEKIEKQVKRT